jgi:hypothetical protein
MDKGRLWDDLWWVFLHILSRVSVAVWIVVSVIVSFAFCSLIYSETQNIWIVPVFAIWFLVLSRIGLEWVRFYWNKILVEEHKLTSPGEK